MIYSAGFLLARRRADAPAQVYAAKFSKSSASSMSNPSPVIRWRKSAKGKTAQQQNCSQAGSVTTCVSLLLALAGTMVLSAPCNKSFAARGSDRMELLGIAHETKLDTDVTPRTVVRVAFQKKPDGWVAFPNPAAGVTLGRGAAGIADRATWTTCVDGSPRGSLTTHLLTPVSQLSLARVHVPDSGQSVPVVGAPSTLYSGWLGNVLTHKPVVLNSLPNCADPDEWRPEAFPVVQVRRILSEMRKATKGVTGCDMDGHPTPFIFEESDIAPPRESLVSNRGDRIVTLQLRRSRQVLGPCLDELLGEAWAPQTFVQRGDGS